MTNILAAQILKDRSNFPLEITDINDLSSSPDVFAVYSFDLKNLLLSDRMIHVASLGVCFEERIDPGYPLIVYYKHSHDKNYRLAPQPSHPIVKREMPV